VLAEVSFIGVTDRGVLREAVLKSLREDISAGPRLPAASRKTSRGARMVCRARK
jgi:bifunctional non-homologous end joining protein LigD